MYMGTRPPPGQYMKVTPTPSAVTPVVMLVIFSVTGYTATSGTGTRPPPGQYMKVTPTPSAVTPVVMLVIFSVTGYTATSGTVYEGYSYTFSWYTASSGTVYEGYSYTFSCNSGYFIDMISATYYKCSSSSSDVTSTLESYLDGTTSTRLTISDSLLGHTTTSCTGYLISSWYCGHDAQLVNHRGPWTLVYKAPAGTTVSGYNDYYSHFADSTTSSTLNDGSVTVMRDFGSGGSAFKSSKLLQWESGITISAVKLSVFKDGEEAAYVIFDARGKGKLEWFDCDNIVGSSYTDIASYSENYCGLSPYSSNYKRNFYINAYGTACTSTYGWIMLKDYNSISGCSVWDPATTSNPYIKYSTSTTLQNFYTGSIGNGDSLAIFIMEWHMVFKGIQGVTPAAGSLETLWTGSTVENDNDDTKTTITNSPSDTVKSSLVEDWQGYFTMIDMVKYAYFTSGEEKAYVVFDGRGTTKSTWFADGKEIYSSYTDITTDTPTTSGITGDTYRKFALIRTSSSCSGLSAWMMVLDVGGSVACSFDNNVQTRPYFLYSGGTTDSVAESGGLWYSAGFPAAHTMGIFVKGFYPVMKWARGQTISPASSVYNLWTGTYTLNEFTTSAHSFAASTATYKSSIVDSWTSYYIKAVRVSMYSGGSEVAYVVFDAHESDKTTWFDCDRILYTNYQDLNRRTGSFTHCSIAGDSSAYRRFFIEYTYSSCTTAGGWIGVFEGSDCGFDNLGTSPFALYSDTLPGFEYNITMDNFCDFSPCQNGGTCYHRGVKYDCVCAGDYYGLDCADRKFRFDYHKFTYLLIKYV
ncbi:uncharacterized protein LOC132563345 [Ylistrum balloti]|uniref:uncharacterized protein LOC132563345 n=1 Tax=Ylistrum balloti TaxID=509963 RepID=UPI002905A2EC|nr:uncharacterized protein LOC132563345 [Ylistrum balloti]